MSSKLREVLIIDDDQTANYMNERVISEMQIAGHVKIFLNGKDALKYILENCGKDHDTCPELIILDHYMPEMDGLEFMQKLHEHGLIEKMRTVFLLLAVHTNIKDLKQFQNLGVQEFTSKPLSKKRLQEAYDKYWANDTAKNSS
jgi:response regulator of citrate/malate metabolism